MGIYLLGLFLLSYTHKSIINIYDMKNKLPTILTIATNDSSGVAGLQADVKTIAANGGYAATVVVALAAQNTQGVFGVEEISCEMIGKQIEAVQNDLDIKAIKIGLIKSSEAARKIYETINKSVPIIIDPVLLTPDLKKELKETSLLTVKELLFEFTYLLTPSTDEASKILDKEIKNVDDMVEACYELQKLGPKNILIKGSHLDGEIITDVLLFENNIYKFETERIKVPEVHGAGCSLSSAIATNMGKGMNLLEATEASFEFVRESIRNHMEIGKGWSAINHFNKK